MIRPERIARDIETIAACSESDLRVGCSRPTFSAPWRRACDYVIDEAKRAGCTVRIDAAGNIHARPAAIGWSARAWLCGSHLDSVPTGGKYDGVVGVVVALEILRAIPEAKIELVIFAEEEGTTFGLGMLGSRTWAGTLSAQELAVLKNRHGENYLTAGAACGVVPGRLAAERFDPSCYEGLIEVHVEQGAALWKAGHPLAVVTAINGRRQYLCTFRGEANHAGSTKMSDRRDALACAADAVLSLESLAKELDRESDHTVITVGRLLLEPNAINVIPGQTAFTIDFRGKSDEILDRGDERIRSLLSRLSAERGLQLELTLTESLPALPLDAGLCDRLRNAGQRLGVALSDVASGALHDTAILAPFLPSVMLFVASKDGISHNPAEYSRTEDIAFAAEVVADAVRS